MGFHPCTCAPCGLYCRYEYRYDHTIDTLSYQRDEHRVHLVVDQLVWCPKRRKAVLTGAIAHECHTRITQVCAEHRWPLLELAIQPDHMHLFVQVFPSPRAADVITLVQGRTSREL